MKYTPKQVAKAIYGSLMSGLAATGTALADGHVTAVEGIGIAAAVIATAGVVFGITNATGPDVTEPPAPAAPPAA